MDGRHGRCWRGIMHNSTTRYCVRAVYLFLLAHLAIIDHSYSPMVSLAGLLSQPRRECDDRIQMRLIRGMTRVGLVFSEHKKGIMSSPFYAASHLSKSFNTSLQRLRLQSCSCNRTTSQYHSFEPLAPSSHLTMKSVLSATTLLIAASQAYVVRLWTGDNCTGAAAERNVYDDTCAPTGGFASLQLIVYGGEYQFMTAYSANACSLPSTFTGCMSGSTKLPLETCFNVESTSNALGSRNYAVGECPE